MDAEGGSAAEQDRRRQQRSRFSLRTRLLVAVAAVAFVGLLVADVTTYAALRSFLVNRVDETLSGSHRTLVDSVLRRHGRLPQDAGAFAAGPRGDCVEDRGRKPEPARVAGR